MIENFGDNNKKYKKKNEQFLTILDKNKKY